MAVTEALREAIWLRGVIGDLGLYQDVIMVYCDNQSAIHLIEDQMYHERTKHIDVRCCFIHELKEAKVKKIAIVDSLVNMLTKLIPLHKIKHCLNLLGICNG